MLMSKKSVDYFVPKIEVQTFEIERGFALSQGESGGGEDIGNNIEGEW